MSGRQKGKIFLVTIIFILFHCISTAGLYAKDFVLVIDAGHGGKDPGTIGNGTKEKDINLSVALKLGQLIRSRHRDVKIIYTRSSDVFIPLQERANIANRNKANLFISIHTNSAPSPSANGAETYVLGLRRSAENLRVAMRENDVIIMEKNYKQTYKGFNPSSTESYIIFEMMQNKHLEQSIHMASEVQRAFVAIGRPNRSVRQDAFLVLRNVSMPSILIELGFISNQAEARFMTSDGGSSALATAIADAFGRYKSKIDGTPAPSYTTKVLQDAQTAKDAAEAIKAEKEERQKRQSEQKKASRKTVIDTEEKETSQSDSNNSLAERLESFRKPDTHKESEKSKSNPASTSSNVAPQAPDKAEIEVTKPEKTTEKKNAAKGKNTKLSTPPIQTRQSGIYFKIQLAATQKQIKASDPEFKGLSPIEIQKDGPLYKAMYGSFKSLTEARKAKTGLGKRFPSSFVVKYENGVRAKTYY